MGVKKKDILTSCQSANTSRERPNSKPISGLKVSLRTRVETEGGNTKVGDFYRS